MPAINTVRVARMAMGSRFEILLHGDDDEVRLRAAGEEALDEIQRLDAQLSTYRLSSEISRINAKAAKGPMPVEPRLFRLLQTAQRYYYETDGAFDITVGPLMKSWGFVNHTGRLPKTADLEEARRKTGMHLVNLNEADFTISFAREGVELDLGAIGKGYAIDEAAEVLREAGIKQAFLHGGNSAIYALGAPPDSSHWKVSVPYPDAEEPGADPEAVLSVVPLSEASLSVSAIWGKAFVVNGKTYGHVIDPRTGWPAEGALLTAVVASSATEADVLSTAFLVLGRTGSENLLHRWTDDLQVLIVSQPDGTGRFPVLQKDFDIINSERAVVSVFKR